MSAHSTPPLRQVQLSDKYTQKEGEIFVTGLQALVRLPIMQLQKDRQHNLKTANFTSGYRGSPLGGLDKAFWQAQKHFETLPIHFQPGLNEDLAATSVWGSQQINMYQTAQYDGVFGMWYGKGPGVDRSIDAFKHANLAGTSKFGGVLALAGDDHGCKSSTMPHQSEMAFMSAFMPILNPSNVQDFLDYGLFGVALSRYSGCWVGFKVTGETVESAAVVDLSLDRYEYTRPTNITLPETGLNIRWPDPPLEQEQRHLSYKLKAAQAYVHANHMDQCLFQAPQKRLGLVTTGKATLDTLQALDLLNLSKEDRDLYGLSLLKIAMPWPLEPLRSCEFAKNHETLLVIEEKQPIIERQLKDNLYHFAERPTILGKQDRTGAPLLPDHGELSPLALAVLIADEILRYAPNEALQYKRNALAATQDKIIPETKTQRLPYYCSGCPHNRSTKVPDGSRALAGIGCHYMAMWMDRHTETPCQMGGEGVPWIGQSPFTSETHIFSNLGDGTYFHSGILAIRAAVAAKVNITYKLLYNDAVAMTGGQPLDGQLEMKSLIQQLHAEGVTEIILLSEHPERYRTIALPHGIIAQDRDQLTPEQERLKHIKGVTVLIYDQTCAAEKRRRRKRGQVRDPKRRVFINDRVCEDCGDCSRQSNCLSVVPLATPYGQKREIDQSSCNKDLTCLDGFCPSFVYVTDASRRKPRALASTPYDDLKNKFTPSLTPPDLPSLDDPYSIVITGVGGTGVVTIGAILGMAAFLEGKGTTVLDQTGLAQKGGAVTTHLRIAKSPTDIHAVRIAKGQANAIIGCDLIVTGSQEILTLFAAGKSRLLLNSTATSTANFTLDPTFTVPEKRLYQRIQEAIGSDDLITTLPARDIATRLLGDAIATNMFLLGAAWQKGLIPVSEQALLQAITLNNVAIDLNKSAFLWGRLSISAPDILEETLARQTETPSQEPFQIPTTWQETLDRNATDLTQYQNAQYAATYRTTLAPLLNAEDTLFPDRTRLRETAVKSLYKLMAYKDEYEVARLYTDPAFRQKLSNSFEEGYQLHISLSPPLFARTDPATGRPKKYIFGSWILPAFALLKQFKFLRGSFFDPFGHSLERKLERHWIQTYEDLIKLVSDNLSDLNYEQAVSLLEIPSYIRGYGPIKLRAFEDASQNLNLLKQRFLQADPPQNPSSDFYSAQAAE